MFRPSSDPQSMPPFPPDSRISGQPHSELQDGGDRGRAAAPPPDPWLLGDFERRASSASGVPGLGGDMRPSQLGLVTAGESNSSPMGSASHHERLTLVKQRLMSILDVPVAAVKGIPIGNLKRLHREIYKEELDEKMLGYEKFSSFLEDVSDILVVVRDDERGNIRVFPKPSQIPTISSETRGGRLSWNELKKAIVRLIHEHADPTTGLLCSQLKPLIKTHVDPFFHERSFGFRRFSQLIRSIDEIDVVWGASEDVRVRPLRPGFPSHRLPQERSDHSPYEASMASVSDSPPYLASLPSSQSPPRKDNLTGQAESMNRSTCCSSSEISRAASAGALCPPPVQEGGEPTSYQLERMSHRGALTRSAYSMDVQSCRSEDKTARSHPLAQIHQAHSVPSSLHSGANPSPSSSFMSASSARPPPLHPHRDASPPFVPPRQQQMAQAPYPPPPPRHTPSSALQNQRHFSPSPPSSARSHGVGNGNGNGYYQTRSGEGQVSPREGKPQVRPASGPQDHGVMDVLQRVCSRLRQVEEQVSRQWDCIQVLQSDNLRLQRCLQAAIAHPPPPSPPSRPPPRAARPTAAPPPPGYSATQAPPAARETSDGNLESLFDFDETFHLRGLGLDGSAEETAIAHQAAGPELSEGSAGDVVSTMAALPLSRQQSGFD
ncbi:unnamed protein product [Vitrella brassicaformis CCMP3155]|uniref:HTH OST-type domain-containing protein n=1 Tax=Vitrella brassicaformis (strain CCMP3155) TaxID=1169540 RepID=A0A0G4ENV7_VITBC|nr:unnamed protein product [Vitrella brassicaformis CCMP3155]|eukprot:CEL98993.1 unnamed protein product [Vitrella brassicaformis CCMP3155]